MKGYSLHVMLRTLDETGQGSMLTLKADREPVLVLDFDGTVCTGDGPIWAYADAVIDEIHRATATADRSARPGDVIGKAQGIRTGLTAFLDGVDGHARYDDGYAAVAALSREHVGDVALQRAYRASRRTLASGQISVSAPAGLADLLAGLGPTVTRVVATNAPDDGVAVTLNSLGLGVMVDAIATDMHKPAGWQVLLPELMAHRDAEFVMAVGDIWENDIRSPRAAGCATALIDRYDQRSGPASLTGRNFEELYDGIRQWADDPLAFAAQHHAW